MVSKGEYSKHLCQSCACKIFTRVSTMSIKITAMIAGRLKARVLRSEIIIWFVYISGLFEEITFPLSHRCTKGKWIICAQDWPSIIDSGDKTAKKYCINFHVKEAESNLSGDGGGGGDAEGDLQNATTASTTSIEAAGSQIEAESFVNLEIVASPTFRTGVPYAGKVCIFSLNSTSIG